MNLTPEELGAGAVLAARGDLEELGDWLEAHLAGHGAYAAFILACAAAADHIIRKGLGKTAGEELQAILRSDPPARPDGSPQWRVGQIFACTLNGSHDMAEDLTWQAIRDFHDDPSALADLLLAACSALRAIGGRR